MTSIKSSRSFATFAPWIKLASAGVIAATLAACGTPPPQPTNAYLAPPRVFTLSSTGFGEGATLPMAYAGNLQSNPNCVGSNVSPPMSWMNAPAGTRSFAFIVYDQEGRDGLGVAHWVGYGIPVTTTGFLEGEMAATSSKYIGGKSSLNLPSYMGPCPPANTGQHHYVYTVIATDLEPTELPPGLTMSELLTRLVGHAKGGSSIVLRFGR